MKNNSIRVPGIGLVIISIFTFTYVHGHTDKTYPGQVGTEPKLEIERAAPNTISTAHPNMYLDQAEIDGIKKKIEAGEEPWISAYNTVIGKANTALNIGPWSVTSQGLDRCGNNNRYCTEKPYCGWKRVDPSLPNCRDGKTNPLADRADYDKARAFSDNVLYLAKAYAFTGDERYAERVILFAKRWCLGSGRMEPSFTNGQSHIELYITLPSFFFAIDLIYNSPSWQGTDKEQILQWVNTIGRSRLDARHDNNFEQFRQNFCASAGALTDDVQLVNESIDEFKATLPRYINDHGQFPEELRRTRSFHYSTYAMLAMTCLAEIAWHRGIDLYNYTKDGRSLRKALDYHDFYCTEPLSTWIEDTGKQQEKDDANEYGRCSLYEMAYSRTQQESYRRAVTETFKGHQRPAFDTYIMGWLTLTHGNLFELEMARNGWVTASSFELENPPMNAVDEDTTTRFSSLTGQAGEWLQFDLGRVQPLDHVTIQFYRQQERWTEFILQKSSNGIVWEDIGGLRRSSTSVPQEFISFPVNTLARYVRIVGQGNEENDWLSINEVEIVLGDIYELLNPSFEEDTLAWEVYRNGPAQVISDTLHKSDGEKSLYLSSGGQGDYAVALSQTVTTLLSANYTAQVDVKAGPDSTFFEEAQLQIFVNGQWKRLFARFKAAGRFLTATVRDFPVLEDQQITFKIWIKAKNGGWVNFDNTQLFVDRGGEQNREGEKGKAVTGDLPYHDLKLYPVPVTNVLNLHLPASVEDEALVKIRDATGRVIYEASIPANENRIDLQELGPGVYYLQLEGSGKWHRVLKR